MVSGVFVSKLGVVDGVEGELFPFPLLAVPFDDWLFELPGVLGAGVLGAITTAGLASAVGTGAKEERLLDDPVVETIIPNTTGAAAVVLEVKVTFFTGKVLVTTTGEGFGAGAGGAVGAGPAGPPPPPAEVTV